MAGQSDVDDRLRSALENQFQSGFTDNIENTITDYVFMTVQWRNQEFSNSKFQWAKLGESVFFKRFCWEKTIFKNFEWAIAHLPPPPPGCASVTVYRNMCVVRIIGEETFFQKKGLCESLDERYLYIRE